MGGGNRFVPLVLRPSAVPEVTDEAQAQADPELAVLSAMAHGQHADACRSAQIALAAGSAVRNLEIGERLLTAQTMDKAIGSR